MTIDTQQHRACIGLFHFVFNAFMYYRAKKAAACFYRTLKLPLSARPSDLVLLFLTAALLLRAGDVEPNPGPNTEMDKLSYQIQTILTTVSQQHAETQRQMSAHHYALSHEMSDIKQRVSYVSRSVQQNTNNIQALHSRLHESEQHAEMLEYELDRVQSELRRNNLKITGLREEARESTIALINKILITLNDNFESASFSFDDFDDAKRVGRRSQDSSRPRPVIVSFCRHESVMSVMSSRSEREKLARSDGIRFGPDLTPSQRKEMERLRSEGRKGYLKNGRVLPVESYGRYPRQRYRGDARHTRDDNNVEEIEMRDRERRDDSDVRRTMSERGSEGHSERNTEDRQRVGVGENRNSVRDRISEIRNSGGEENWHREGEVEQRDSARKRRERQVMNEEETVTLSDTVTVADVHHPPAHVPVYDPLDWHAPNNLTNGAYLEEAAAMSDNLSQFGDAAGASVGQSHVRHSPLSNAGAEGRGEDVRDAEAVDHSQGGDAVDSLPSCTPPLRGFGRGSPIDTCHASGFSAGSAGSIGSGRGSRSPLDSAPAAHSPHESPRRLRSHAQSSTEQGPGLNKSWRDVFARGRAGSPRDGGRGRGLNPQSSGTRADGAHVRGKAGDK